MEQIIQSKKSNCIFWLGKHINAKQYPSDDLAKDNGVFILNQENQNANCSSSSILLIIEPDFSTDVAEIVTVPMQRKTSHLFRVIKSTFLHYLLYYKVYTHKET